MKFSCYLYKIHLWSDQISQTYIMYVKTLGAFFPPIIFRDDRWNHKLLLKSRGGLALKWLDNFCLCLYKYIRAIMERGFGGNND